MSSALVVTGRTGKSHLTIAIARALIRNGIRGRSFNVVDLVNRLDTESRAGKQVRTAIGGQYLLPIDTPMQPSWNSGSARTNRNTKAAIHLKNQLEIEELTLPPAPNPV